MHAHSDKPHAPAHTHTHTHSCAQISHDPAHTPVEMLAFTPTPALARTRHTFIPFGSAAICSEKAQRAINSKVDH